MINPALAVTIRIQSIAPLLVVKPKTTLAPMIPASRRRERQSCVLLSSRCHRNLLSETSSAMVDDGIRGIKRRWSLCGQDIWLQ